LKQPLWLLVRGVFLCLLKMKRKSYGHEPQDNIFIHDSRWLQRSP
jgi:hypothetical protein